ncbi:MAG TPA: TIGR00159 family protein [Desulfobacteraceae bacterium]|nr:TIGR00159 family protein [Desulfobacteraceae bacterium]
MKTLAFFLASLRWQDLVDLLLNSYILFRLYVLFRGTVMVRVLTGLALLWIAQSVSGRLGLILTSWVIQGIIAAGALIIIIVFRNEIRSVFQARSLKSILWGFPRHSVQTPIEAVTAAVYELARKRIGALIVIPAEKDLGDIFQNGIPVDARISREMLVSIFWPGNPVHDGAAVLNGNRIAQVGAILPLSRREDLPSHYGTRHRAAAGLTEQSDAMVIVVSEETGRVVAARSGRLVPIEDNVSLTRMLAEHTVQAAPGAPTRDERIDYAIAGLVCLMLVGGVWFSFSRGEETLTSLEVPIEYLKPGVATEIVETSTGAVRLDLSGSGPLIRALRPEQVKVQVNLENMGSGPHTVVLTPEMVRLPPGVSLKKMTPTAVDLTLDVVGEKSLPIQVDWVGPLPKGVRIVSVEVTPPRTRIVGSRSELSGLATIYTEKVSLTGITSSGSLTVGLVLPDGITGIAPGAADRVTVNYTVAPAKP